MHEWAPLLLDVVFFHHVSHFLQLNKSPKQEGNVSKMCRLHTYESAPWVWSINRAVCSMLSIILPLCHHCMCYLFWIWRAPVLLSLTSIVLLQLCSFPTGLIKISPYLIPTVSDLFSRGVQGGGWSPLNNYKRLWSIAVGSVCFLSFGWKWWWNAGISDLP